jgi:hypothetical protein
MVWVTDGRNTASPISSAAICHTTASATSPAAPVASRRVRARRLARR